MFPNPPTFVSSGQGVPLVRGCNLSFFCLATPQQVVPALSETSFEIAKHEMGGPLGKSGSGKSCLAQGFLRLLPLNAQVRRGKVVRHLQEVQLPAPSGVYDAYPHQWSGGQWHWLARALFCFARPPIDDESMRLLDGNKQAQILSLWKDWNAKFGTAILLIIHNVILRAGGQL